MKVSNTNRNFVLDLDQGKYYHFAMPDLLIRNLPREVNARLEQLAKASRRSKEKQAMVLIETGLGLAAADTCGELADRIWAAPAPEVDVKAVDSYIKSRGRRSNRP